MTDDADLTLHESGLGYTRVTDPDCPSKNAYAWDSDQCLTLPVEAWDAFVATLDRPGRMDPKLAEALSRPRFFNVIDENPHRWHPSAADHHDRGENCGEVECGRCNHHLPDCTRDHHPDAACNPEDGV